MTRSFWKTHWLQIVIFYWSTRFFLCVLGIFAMASIPSLKRAAQIPTPLYPSFFQKMDFAAYAPERERSSFFEMWAHWDSEWYIDIAKYGYSPTPVFREYRNVVFLPLYPLSIRVGSFFYADPVFWGYVISLLASTLLMILFYELVCLDLDAQTAWRSVVYFCCFPTSFYLSAVYTESLFLVFTVASFYCARKNQWGWASLWGAFSVWTRVTGVFLIVPLVWLFWTQYSKNTGLWKNVFKLLLIPFSFLVLCFFFWTFTGDPFIFLQAQQAWERGHSLPWEPFFDFFRQGQIYHFMNASHDFILSLLAIALLPFIWKRWPVFGIYSSYILFLPLTTGVLMSMSRYVLSCFPLFIALGVLGQYPLIDRILLIVFTLSLGGFAGLFACGYWVG